MQFNIASAQTLETLIPHVRVTSTEPDLVSFNEARLGVKVPASLDACRVVAFENIEDAARNGLHYVELRFSPGYMAMAHQLPIAGVVEAVIDGAATVVTRLCRGTTRHYEPYLRRGGMPAA